jgi:hypothetical protein
MQVHKDVVATVRNIRALAASADQLSRDIESHRVRVALGGPVEAASVQSTHHTNIVHAANRASVTAISQLGQFCRDFHSVYATAFAALPPDLQKAMAAI